MQPNVNGGHYLFFRVAEFNVRVNGAGQNYREQRHTVYAGWGVKHQAAAQHFNKAQQTHKPKRVAPAFKLLHFFFLAE